MRIVKQLALAAATSSAILVLAVVSDAALDDLSSCARRAGGCASRQRCVDAKGSWVNWPWPNVPTLSPPCPGTSPEPAEKK